MKVIVTSGGTSEKIDDVRTITNMSTGRLGSLIANSFYNIDENIEIIYICSGSAVLPDIPCSIVKINSAIELKESLETILANQKIDAVIHAMAVSDYYVSGLCNLEKIISRVSENLYNYKESLKSSVDISNMIKTEIAENNIDAKEQKKIHSDIDDLIIFMKKTPKVINIIKKLQPKTILVGFKLLVNVSEEKLLEVGTNLLIKNKCDFVLANDLNNISKDYHKGILINSDSTYVHLESKDEIAKAITQNVVTKIRGEKD